MSQRKNLTVSDFVSQIKSVVNTEPQFQNVAIVGELSNFTAHGSGHFYFSIKDEKASIRCVMFRSNSFKVKFRPKDGDKVVIVGNLDIYAQTGLIQLVVRQMNLDGLGDLYIEFERLKNDLFKKGLFDEAHKKDLPLYPRRIGIITGENTAAHADMMRTAKERWPYAEIHYYFSLVQGEFAKDNLINQVLEADKDKLDVIVIARGGGSIEDLWPFNELELIITVFNATTPIVSGIGHESDVTLLDYVADYRAATPTAAIVAVTPSASDISIQLRNIKNTFYRYTVNLLNQKQNTLKQIQETKTFREPLSILDSHYMHLDLLNTKLISQTTIFHESQKKLQRFNTELSENLNRKIFVGHLKRQEQTNLIQNSIQKRIVKEQEILDRMSLKNIQLMDTRLQVYKHRLIMLFQKFDYLSPFKIMQRGYGIINHDNKVIKSIQELKKNDEVTIQLKDGTFDAQISHIKGENNE